MHTYVTVALCVYVRAYMCVYLHMYVVCLRVCMCMCRCTVCMSVSMDGYVCEIIIVTFDSLNAKHMPHTQRFDYMIVNFIGEIG